MNPLLKTKTVVLVGMFNPQDYDKYFFIKNGIINENDILPVSQFTNQVSQIVSKDFNIVVFVNQIIITSINPNTDDNIDKISYIIIANSKLHIINSMGINFSWHETYQNQDESIKASKELFYNPNNTLNKEYFNSEDCAYGIYMSKKVKNARLKLEVKPSKSQFMSKPEIINDDIVFAFNFDFRLESHDRKKESLDIISDYKFYELESQKIVTLYKK